MIGPESRHKLIQEAFRNLLAAGKINIPDKTDAVVMLSADSIGEVNEEDRARIEYSLELVKEITAKRAGKDAAGIGEEDLDSKGPFLIINAETEQLPLLQELMRDLHFPLSKIHWQDCGHTGEANTKTQFAAINQDPKLKKLQHLTFVTSSYHVPRVRRTAEANLDSRLNFDVLPVPLSKYSYNVFSKVRGEVERIERYFGKETVRSD